MSKSEAKPDSTSLATPETTGLGCGVRLGWMLFGTVALIISTMFIVHAQGRISTADAVFWAVVAACIVLRYVDIAYMNGMTVSGEPATAAHWRRYTVWMLVGSAAVWGAAHGAGRLWG